MPGAYPFLVILSLLIGGANVFFIAKTDEGMKVMTSFKKNVHREVEAWELRFLKSLGIVDLNVPDDNIEFCSNKYGPYGKGPIAQRFALTHFVDHNLDCLWSVTSDSCGNTYDDICANNGFVTYFADDDNDASVNISLLAAPISLQHTNDFRDILSRLYPSLWYFVRTAWIHLDENGPPNGPHSQLLVQNARMIMWRTGTEVVSMVGLRPMSPPPRPTDHHIDTTTPTSGSLLNAIDRKRKNRSLKRRIEKGEILEADVASQFHRPKKAA